MKTLQSLLCLGLLTILQPSARADVAVQFGSFSLRTDSQTTFGWAFTLSEPLFVTNLGYFDFQGGGLTDSHPVAIWTSAGGQPLVFATVPAGTAGTLLNGFRYVSLAPVLLPAGAYTIGGFSPNFSDSVANSVSNLTTAPGITYVGSRSAQGSSLMFPAGDTQGFPNGNFGPNFQFMPVPEPSVTALFLLSGAAGILMRKRRKFMKRRHLFALCLSVAAATAQGAIIPVFNTNDALAGSLRQAIQDANPAGGDTIVFQIPTSSPGFNAATGVYTIGLTSTDLFINKSLTITGGGQKIIIQRASGTLRIFRIEAGHAVTIEGVTIANGLESGAAGISNQGNLTLRNCTMYGNSTGPAGNQGGAITSSGSLQLTNCTITGNSVAAGVDGGAIFAGGNLTIDNSTITANTGNSAVRKEGGAARVRNSIIAANTAGRGDVSGAFLSEGYNIVGTQASGTTGFGVTGDQLGASAAQVNLGSLQDNGGPTSTRRPQPGSVAIDQGKRGVDANNQPINTDQRGYVRPIDLPAIPNAVGGDGSDIGAVETGPTQSGPTLTVTNTAEHDDGSCTTDECTLLEAITAANSNADQSTVDFAPGVTGTITNSVFEGLAITNPVSIMGPGARQLALSGRPGAGVRVFRVSAANVNISGLTFKNTTSGFHGGAIYNTGQLTLSDCSIENNQTFGSVGSETNGGGIYNASGATLGLMRCTFKANVAQTFGGGVYSEGVVTATNCTFTENRAVRGGGLISRFNGGAARMTLRNCTITNNTATDGVASPGFGGGGVFAEGGNTQYFASNNLIAGNFATNDPDIRGNYTTQGNNLIGKIGDATGFTNGVNGDKVGTVAVPLNAQFGSFGSNGGHTNTWSLLANSPAINAGNDALAPATDQRGFGRNGVSDIGAFEFGGVAPPVQVVSAVSRKTHGSSGTFDINLALTGTPTVECRSGGANGDYTVIFRFVNTLASVGSAAVTSGAGFVSSSQVGSDARQYVVNLSGITNAQRVTITLFNVTDSLQYNSASVPITLGFLLGDTNNNGTVSASDVAQAKSQSGQAITAANFRADVTANGGSINASDVGLVKSASGTQLPP